MMEDKKERNRDVGGPLAALGILAVIALVFSGRMSLWFGISEGGLYKSGIGPVCRFRLDGNGISAAGQMIDGVNKAIEICRRMNATRAEIQITGDAIVGTIEHLQQALLAAGIEVLSNRPTGGGL
jgi:hypothetical protein